MTWWEREVCFRDKVFTGERKQRDRSKRGTRRFRDVAEAAAAGTRARRRAVGLRTERTKRIAATVAGDQVKALGLQVGAVLTAAFA